MKKLFVSMFVIASMAFAGCGESNNDNGDNNNGDNNNPGNHDTPTVVVDNSLKGTNYIPIILDGESSEAIANKIVADAHINNFVGENGTAYNGGVNLWHWNEAFTTQDCTGPNYYGLLDGWVSYVINTGMGWFGLGIHASTKTNLVGVGADGSVAANQADLIATSKKILTALSNMDATYALHLALKSQRQGVYNFRVYDGVNEFNILVGTKEGEGDFYFQRDGEWHEVVVPVSWLINQGFNAANIKDQEELNILALCQPADGYAWPTDLNLDAVFFYQPAK